VGREWEGGNSEKLEHTGGAPYCRDFLQLHSKSKILQYRAWGNQDDWRSMHVRMHVRMYDLHTSGETMLRLFVSTKTQLT